ncbi:hypothetical protein PVOR_02830 [Paenibacillus vortex V453]|uniref:Uncharacterized protein n=1 Tax=Paenibacillus vortex V453 TaxID=715225 RepID=A0A2R9T0Y0_9BACL|nr:hypothetical protein PVOR_02830 [Paenibacillus vortex V453]
MHSVAFFDKISTKQGIHKCFVHAEKAAFRTWRHMLMTDKDVELEYFLNKHFLEITRL